jgi:SAM-dependent methyltransferase
MENELFDEMYKVETQHWWFVARRKIIESVILKLDLAKDSHILDAGCGNGDNLELLSNYGDVIAMDTDDNALVNARARHIGKVLKGELPGNLPESIRKDNDLIVILDVLEHIDDDAGSLAVLRNCVKDNGKLIITVPAYQCLLSNHDKLHHHKRRYTAKYLKKLIEDNGWKVDYISYFNTFLFPLALIDRVKQIVFPPTKDNILNVPHKIINCFLEKIFSFESSLIGKFIFPFGLSIMVIAKKI